MPGILPVKTQEFLRDPSSIEPFHILTSHPRLSRLAGSEQLQFDLRRLDPDQFSFPYHFHRQAEELMYMIEGSLTLRTPEGLEIVCQGDLLFFEKGESGAHQLYNHTRTPATYLDIKTVMLNDICEYPDSGKVNISQEREVFEKRSQVDYFKGEETIKAVWAKLKKK